MLPNLLKNSVCKLGISCELPGIITSAATTFGTLLLKIGFTVLIRASVTDTGGPSKLFSVQ